MSKSLKLLCAGVMGAAVLSGVTAGSAMAVGFEIDITYYSDASHSTIVGSYYKGCGQRPIMVGSYSDFYDYVSTPCEDEPGPIDP